MAARRVDGDGVPLGVFGRYHGVHEKESSFFEWIAKRRTKINLVFLAGAATVWFANNPVSGEADPIQNDTPVIEAAGPDLLRTIMSNEVVFAVGSVPTADGKFCVRNPMIVNGEFVAIGRSDPKNSETTVAVFIGDVGSRNNETNKGPLAWSEELGSFVVSGTTQVVGRGEMLADGSTCK